MWADTAVAQVPDDTYWWNHGRNGARDAGLGEFHTDLGGLVGFKTYDIPGHFYHEPHKSNIIERFFDLESLNAYLTTHDLGSLQPEVFVEMEGSVSVWWLKDVIQGVQGEAGESGRLNYRCYRVNGASLRLKWRAEADPRWLFIEFLPNTRNPLTDYNLGGLGDELSEPFQGMPHNVDQQIIRAGHYVLQVFENYGNDAFVALQRAQDMIYWMRHAGGFQIDRVYAFGGSWSAVPANAAALLMPKLVRAAYAGGFLPFLALESERGGWNKLLTHMQSGIGTQAWVTPPRVHGHPETFSLEEQVHVPELVGNSELGAFSVIQRAAELTQNLIGPVGNCDPITNHHFWSSETPGPSGTIRWTTYLWQGHSEPPAFPGNEYALWRGDELERMTTEVDKEEATSNPPIKPDPPVDAVVNPYLHTLAAEPQSEPSGAGESPLLERVDFQEPLGGASIPWIGQGVFPGAFDTMKLMKFLGPQATRLVFGNFEGFVHVMRVENGGGTEEPILVDEWRSPPLGWGLTALDVVDRGGNEKLIYVANSFGRIFKIEVGGPGSYSEPKLLADSAVTVPGQGGGGLVHMLTTGDFVAPIEGKEVVLQNELGEWVLLSGTGTEVARTARTRDPANGVDNVTGPAGAALAANVDEDNADELIVPCVDGLVRRIDYEAGRLEVDVISPWLRNVPRSCLFWDKDRNPANGYYLILGTKPHPDRFPEALKLLFIDSTNAENSTLVAGYSGGAIRSTPIALHWIDAAANRFLAAGGDEIAVLEVTASGFVEPSSPTTKTIRIPNTKSELCGATTFGAGSAPEHEDYIYASMPNGRIFVMDRETLAFARTTRQLDRPGDEALEPYDKYHSNRTFGHCFGATLFDPDGPLTARPRVFVDDSQVPYLKANGSRPGLYRRFATIEGESGTIDDYVGHTDGAEKEILRQRSLSMWRDRETNELWYYTWPEAMCAAEIPGHDPQPWRFTMFSGGKPAGGYIFYARGSPEVPLSGFLDTFDVPPEPGQEFLPWIGPNKYRGQVSTQCHLRSHMYHGHSCRVADLPRNGSQVAHVVVGTIGGLVYAVDPTAEDNALSYYSHDLGWHIVGMDIADLDGDGENEVLVGNFMDTGTWRDFRDRRPNTNQARLYILDPDPAFRGTARLFRTTKINISGVGAESFGFTSGLFGVKIDDIDGDGDFEIWCGDAAGFVYALYFDATASRTWKCFYRTESLGTYAGAYNTIFAIKEDPEDPHSRTKNLVVFTSGYVYRFDVLAGMVPD
ncbi:MAG: hypothetical protein AB1486_03710 [Planctomycetota bacterium]